MVKRYTHGCTGLLLRDDGEWCRFADYDALAARLAEAERVINLSIRAMRAPIDAWKGELERPALDAANAFLRPTDSAPAVPHWFCAECRGQAMTSDGPIIHSATCSRDSAPAVQPCGHPWKAQHDFKCILCSSPGRAP